MFGIGWGELALIFVLVLILFGPERAQGIFRAFGKGIKEFKDAMSGLSAPEPTKKADFQEKIQSPKSVSNTPESTQDNTKDHDE